MFRFTLLAALVAGSLHAQPQHIAPTAALAPVDELKSFKVPAGFEVQLVAAEPDIMKPMQIAFDARGRLWVTTSQEYPFPAQGRDGKDKLFVLEDFDATGRAKKITTFADDLNIPIGILPLPSGNEVIVQSIPNIWKLTDTDRDGKADKKEILYGPFGFNDTHGMVNSFTLGYDGWVYATHGFNNRSTVKGKDGHTIDIQSGHTFRFRPDGSRIEVWTRGQVNPFGMCFDPWGNLYTADCHSKPITQLIRGAFYDSFGKPHDGLGYGPNMINHDHGSTALCGLTWYEAEQFPKEYQGTLFLGNVVTNRINFDKIDFVGSTPKAIQKPDFLVSTDPWFRPVDLKLGPDGALYVADFYNKIIGHYEVDLKHPDRDKLRGRVWRIAWKGNEDKAKLNPVTNLVEASSEKLFELSQSENFTTRQLAALQLISRGERANKTHDAKLISLNDNQAAIESWAVASKEAGAVPLQDFKSAWAVAQLVRQIGNQSAEMTPAQKKFVQQQLNHPEVQVVRAAVQTITMRPDRFDPEPTLELLSKTGAFDTHLRHAVRIALRDQLLSRTDWSKLANSDAEVRLLGDLCPGIPNQTASEFLLNSLSKQPAERRPQYVEQIVRHGEDSCVEKVIDFIRKSEPNDTRSRTALLASLQKGLQQKGNPFPDAAKPLTEELCTKCLSDSSPQTIQLGIDLAGATRLPKLFDPVREFLSRKDRNENQRAAAVTTLVAIDGGKAIPALASTLLDANESIVVRERIVASLAPLNQTPAYNLLLKSLQTAPARLANSIAFGLAITPEGAEQLLKAIEQGKTSARVLQEKNVRDRLNASRIAATRIDELTKGLPSVEQKMLQLMQQRRDGFGKSKSEATLGKEVFTKNCANCHQLGGQGAKVGPQLDGVGNRGLDRLLEDMLDPSRNVDQALRTTRIVKKDGGIIEGLLLREEGKVLVLADSMGKELRLPSDDVESKRTLLTSPMPANLAEIIPEAEFYHLLQYLLQQRVKE